MPKSFSLCFINVLLVGKLVIQAHAQTSANLGQDKTREVYDIMLEALTKSITVPKRVLLALTPHERPLLLTRCWCLYEIYIAWKVGAEVSCGFVPQAEQKVITSLTRNDRLITDMLATVDAAKSQATVESDRLMILSLIEQAGVDIFNLFVQVAGPKLQLVQGLSKIRIPIWKSLGRALAICLTCVTRTCTHLKCGCTGIVHQIIFTAVFAFSPESQPEYDCSFSP